MSNVLKALARGGAAETDPNFKQTVLLLHGDGTNGAQNNTFLDSSSNNFTITRNPATGPNAPTQGTFSPFSLSGGYWSNYFDGTDDYLSVADNAVLRPGAGAFTLEAWVYRNASGAAHTVYAKGGASTGIVLQVTSTNVLRFTHTTTNIDSTGTVAANAWVHVAVVREGTGTNQTKLYINGVQDGQGTVSTDFTQTEEVRIGTNRGATDDFAGYISNVRFVKGSALYTAGFTPSTVPLTTTSQNASSSEVELLTCQSNRFVDNSTNAFTITRNGDVRVTPFSPFAPTAAYSAGTNGGSGYFDGTGDYLSRAFTSTTDGMYLQGSTYTIEAWVYPNALTGTQYIYICNASNVAQYGYNTLYLSGTSVAFATRISTGGTEYARSGGTLTVGQWAHIAVSVSSNVAKLFLNGVQIGADLTIAANTFTPTGAGIGLNQNGAAGGTAFNGYISNLRLVQGQALTTGDFTLPAAPVTTSSVGWTGTNAAASLTGTTSLLLNFTNAGIIDNTGKNVLETVGNAQIDTAVKKFGTGSLEFDGTGDYLIIPDSPELWFSNGNFTVELWANFSVATSGVAYVFVGQATDAFNVNAGFAFLRHSSNKLRFIFTDDGTGASGYKICDSTNNFLPTTGVWYHLAATRSGDTFKLFIDGVEVGSATLTASIFNSTRPITIGADSVGAVAFNGYIDDLRITKGVARYPTEPFPTKEFPDL